VCLAGHTTLPPIVGEVAEIVTALPPTQVSVEQLFSALRLVKSDLRASMKDLVEVVLFLRTNVGTTKPLQMLVHDKVTNKLLSDTASITLVKIKIESKRALVFII